MFHVKRRRNAILNRDSSGERNAKKMTQRSHLVDVVLRDETFQAFELTVGDFYLGASVVAADDSHGGIVVDLLGGESFAEASDHSADSALPFQIDQLREGVLVGIDGDCVLAVVRDQLMSTTAQRERASNYECADDERRNSHREFTSIAGSSMSITKTAISLCGEIRVADENCEGFGRVIGFGVRARRA